MIQERTRRRLDERLAREQSGQRLPSVVAGVVRGGELAWSGGLGRVDGEPPDAGVQYRAGSITKTFVAVAVLRLRDQGRVRLTDAIGSYLDAGAVSAAVGAATIGQLLSHTAGLRAETAGPWWERTEGASFDRLVADSLGADAMRWRAGRRYHYSNVGYALLGRLLTTQHGRPWHEVITEDLLRPLGMTRTIGSQGRRGRRLARFPHPPFNPYVRFSRIRLTDDLLDMVTLPSDSGRCR